MQSHLSSVLSTLNRLLTAKDKDKDKKERDKFNTNMMCSERTAGEILKVHAVHCLCTLLRALRQATNREVVTQLTLEGFRAVRQTLGENVPLLRAAGAQLLEDLGLYICAPTPRHILRTNPVKEKDCILGLDTLLTLALSYHSQTHRAYATLLALALTISTLTPQTNNISSSSSDLSAVPSSSATTTSSSTTSASSFSLSTSATTALNSSTNRELNLTVPENFDLASLLHHLEILWNYHLTKGTLEYAVSTWLTFIQHLTLKTIQHNLNLLVSQLFRLLITPSLLSSVRRSVWLWEGKCSRQFTHSSES